MVVLGGAVMLGGAAVLGGVVSGDCPTRAGGSGDVRAVRAVELGDGRSHQLGIITLGFTGIRRRTGDIRAPALPSTVVFLGGSRKLWPSTLSKNGPQRLIDVAYWRVWRSSCYR